MQLKLPTYTEMRSEAFHSVKNCKQKMFPGNNRQENMLGNFVIKQNGAEIRHNEGIAQSTLFSL